MANVEAAGDEEILYPSMNSEDYFPSEVRTKYCVKRLYLLNSNKCQLNCIKEI
jgi:hypothetical protein